MGIWVSTVVTSSFFLQFWRIFWNLPTKILEGYLLDGTCAGCNGCDTFLSSGWALTMVLEIKLFPVCLYYFLTAGDLLN